MLCFSTLPFDPAQKAELCFFVFLLIERKCFSTKGLNFVLYTIENRNYLTKYFVY